MQSRGTWRHLLPIPLMVVAAALACPAQPGDEGRGIVTDTEAFLLMPAELVAGPSVDEAVWSPDGEYVLVTQTYTRITADMVESALKSGGGPSGGPPGETGLVLWTRKSGQTRVLWRQALSDGGITGVRWLPGSSVAIAESVRALPRQPGSTDVQRAHCLLRIHAPTGVARVVVEVPEPGNLRTYVSPAAAMALVQRMAVIVQPSAEDGRPATFVRDEALVPVSPSGASAPVRIPGGFPVFAVDWAQDGRAILRCTPVPAVPGSPREVVFLLDPRRGTVEPAQGAQPVAAPAAPVPSRFTVRRGSAEIRQDGTSQTVTPLWLEITGKAERPRALLTAEGQWGSVSPRGDTVLYKAQGALWAASLVRLPRAVLDAARQAALRTMALSNAKQLGLGLIMWAQDNDDRLPGADFSPASLTPYVKNEKLFEGFSYTYAGGPMSDMAKPAETELGFVTGPGGRAIIYGDGHVRWRPD